MQKVTGDGEKEALGINEIHKVEQGDLCFVDHPKYYDACLNSSATHIIINTTEVIVPDGKTLLVLQPILSKLILRSWTISGPFTAATKPVSDTAAIGEGTIVMPNVFIGKDVKIGNNCIIHPNVSIMDYSAIGNNVVIQAGTVMGSDAFITNAKNRVMPGTGE